MDQKRAGNPLPLILRVNGDQREFFAASNLIDLLAELDLEPSTVLIELNGEATLRADWVHTVLAQGDEVEILRVAAGG